VRCDVVPDTASLPAYLSGPDDGRDVAREQGRKVIARNRRAYYNYRIEDTYEAGLVLTGTEVKSLRMGRASLQDGFAQITDGEVWLHNVHIPPYAPATRDNHEPERPRKLLMHRRELDKLAGRAAERGLTLVPTRIYFSGAHAKAEIALARGKDLYDKRQTLRDRDSKRDIERGVREAQR